MKPDAGRLYTSALKKNDSFMAKNTSHVTRHLRIQYTPSLRSFNIIRRSAPHTLLLQPAQESSIRVSVTHV